MRRRLRHGPLAGAFLTLVSLTLGLPRGEAGSATDSEAAPPERPNIVCIIADDQTWTTLGHLGLESVKTPNLDRLARRGMVFTHAYNMGSWSGAVCVASRTMLNSGRFIWNARRIYDQSEAERREGRWWSEHMKRAGYSTWMTGKWHCRADASKAFETTAHIRGGMPNQTPEGYDRPLDGKPDPWTTWDPSFGGFWEGGKHWSEVLGDDATGFISEAARDERPFFMYLAFNAPHDPRQSPKEFVDAYPEASVRLPSNYLPEYPYKDAIGCGKGLRDEALAPFPRTAHAVKVHIGEYFALITHMDREIGRILDAIDASGRGDDTWIFFTADHGLAVGRHGLMGKQNLYEHSVRVPFIVAGPGVEAGARRDAPIYLQDMMATTLELAGVERPEHVEFRSLLPLIRGESHTPYESVYGAYLELQRMVIQNGFKLIAYPKVPRVRLYDLGRDPDERQDLADDPTQEERVRKLFAELRRLEVELGGALDLAAAFPALAR